VNDATKNKKTKKKQRPHLRMYLYDLRKEKGISIYEITNRLFLSKPYYYQIEQGLKGHKMDVIFLNDLATLLDVTFDVICKGELEYQKERRELGIRYETRWVIDDEV